MKYSTNIVLATLVAGAALIGCSAESNPQEGSESARMGAVQAALKVNSNGLQVVGKTASVAYDLSCGGQVVKTGAIPVPLDGSTVSGFFGSVPPATGCIVKLSTTVSLDKDLNTNGALDDQATCKGQSALFNVAPGSMSDLGNIALTCNVDTTGDLQFAATIALVEQSLDTFFVGPLSIVKEGTVVPPVSLQIKTPAKDPAVSYAWAVIPSTGGTFVGCGATPADCSFICGADGKFSIQLTGSFGTNTLTRSVDVTCAGLNVVCGNGAKEGAEGCDDGNVVAGDGCSATCVDEFCGDGVKNDGANEQCEDGNTNDNDLCGNDCKLPVCGDGEVEGTETCDDTAPGCVSCQVVIVGPKCGDGIVNQASEECDTGGASATCTALCKRPELNPQCNSCLEAADPDLAALNQACTADAECAAVRKCVVDSDCFTGAKSPSECYCGPTASIGQCVEPSFVAPGLCAAQIRAAMAKDGQALSNANIVGVLTSATTTSGKAFGILIPAAEGGICIAECTL